MPRCISFAFSSLCLLILLSSLTHAQNLENYRLGAGDSIKITVWDEPDLTLEILLADTGSFNYPFLGTINSAGLTIDELKQRLKESLSPDFLLNPDINVQIISYRGFFIRGEVRSPGNYPFQPGLTLRKAIALAGGLTERASKSKMMIISDNDPDKKERKAAPETLIQPGDTINVEQSFF